MYESLYDTRVYATSTAIATNTTATTKCATIWTYSNCSICSSGSRIIIIISWSIVIVIIIIIIIVIIVTVITII